MPIQKIDPLNNTTTITYDSTGLYPNKIQYPTTGSVQHIEQPSYDAGTGELLSNVDQNGNTTRVTYDNMRRRVLVTPPTSGGTISYCYTDEGGSGCSLASGPPYAVVTTRQITSSLNEVTTNIVDNLGRLSQTQLNSDPSGTTYSVVTYDLVG